MEPDAAGRGKLRLPVHSVALCAIFISVLFYFLVREAYTPAHITAGQQLFLVIYAVLLGSVSSLGILRVFRGKDRWSLGKSRGKRFLFYFVCVLGLEGVVFALRLPPFYVNVLQHTIYLPLMYIFLGRTGTQAWLEPVRTPTYPIGGAVDDTGRDLVLSMSLRKPVFLLLASLAFVLSGVWLLHRSPVLAWTGILFFGLGILISFLMFIPGFCSLVLRRDGFTMHYVGRRWTCRWDETSDFTVVQSVQGPRVAWNTTQSGGRRSALLQEVYGRDLILPDNYGVPAHDLCAMMVERRDAALQRPA